MAMVLMLALMPCASAAETADKFTDVPEDAWYKPELDYAVFNGYISGTSASTFSPDGDVTRGQFVTAFGRLPGPENAASFVIANRFTDVGNNAYYAPYVVWSAKLGVVQGTGSTTFSPDATITVEQMGTILANYISYVNEYGIELSDYVPSAEYKDASSISQWAMDNMEVARQYDLLTTGADGHVSPHKSVTRAECAVSIVRLAKALGYGVLSQWHQI